MSFDFKVADLSLAGFGRKEIELAEHEMPGLMAIRREQAEAQPLRGARISDGRSDRIARRSRRRGPLGVLQHLFHPGPRGGGSGRGPRRVVDRAARRAGVRLEG